jgi:hypothetical protein
VTEDEVLITVVVLIIFIMISTAVYVAVRSQ